MQVCVCVCVCMHACVCVCMCVCCVVCVYVCVYAYVYVCVCESVAFSYHSLLLLLLFKNSNRKLNIMPIYLDLSCKSVCHCQRPTGVFACVVLAHTDSTGYLHHKEVTINTGEKKSGPNRIHKYTLVSLLMLPNITHLLTHTLCHNFFLFCNGN